MEQQPAPGHSLVLRRYFPAQPLHRVRTQHPSRADGQQLFFQRLYSALYSSGLALSFIFDLEGERAQTFDIHVLGDSVLPTRRLFPVLAIEMRASCSFRHPFSGAAALFRRRFCEGAYNLPRHHFYSYV